MSILMFIVGLFAAPNVAMSWDEPTLKDGVYQIGTASELEWFSEFVAAGNLEVKAVLTADIDLTGITHQPIGPGANDTKKFNGEFDGQHHRIKNMIINDESNQAVGFFGFVRGTAKIKNIIIDKSCSITGKDCVGGLIGKIQQDGNPTLILNCVNEADVTSTTNAAAGIIGAGASPYPFFQMYNCVNLGNITGVKKVACFDGYNAKSGTNSRIWHCYSTGVLTPVDKNLGNMFIGSYRDCNASYDLVNAGEGWQGEQVAWTTADPVASGELCWYLNNYKNDQFPNHADAVSFKQEIGVDAYPMPVPEGKTVYQNATYRCDGKAIGAVYYSNANESTIPDHTPNGKGFCGVCGQLVQTTIDKDVDGFYIIAKAADLEVFANMVNASTEVLSAKLTANIDFADGTDETVHTSIGTTTNPFKGTFDGQGYTISNLVVDSPYDNAGLIGYAIGGVTVKNVTLDNTCSIKGKVGVGLVGLVKGSGNTYLTNLGYEGTISHVTGGKNGGGILGGNSGSQAKIYMTGCYMTGTVVGLSEDGAVSGWAGSNKPVVTSCWNSGTVENEGTTTAGMYCVRDQSSGTFTSCFSTVGDQWLPNIDASAIASGELCYKLNAGVGDIWYQTLGVDAQPTTDPTHKKVYFDGTSYTNEKPAKATLQVIEGTNFDGGEGSSKVFDGNLDTKWCANGNSDPTQCYVIYEASTPTYLMGYKMSTGGDTQTYPGRNPKEFRIQGSNDKASWTDVYYQKDDNLLEAKNKETYTVYFNTSTQYKYFRFTVVSSDGGTFFQISELELLASEFGVKVKEGNAAALDGNTNAKWEGNPTQTVTLQILGEPLNMAGYQFTTGNDNASYTGRNPKDFTIETKTADGDWQQADKKVGYTLMQDKNFYPYIFGMQTPQTAVGEVRITVTATQGGGYFQLGEVAVIGCTEAHNFVSAEKVQKDATCYEAGVKYTQQCANCGAWTGEAEIEPLGHDFQGGVCTRCECPETLPFKGVDIAAGKYYIYNIETGQWLGDNMSNGDRYHTSLDINRHGLIWNLATMEG
ncbi:MAG: discoidin domain-containing protein, partial [Bacteroidaceae bacterium]|nr:discoidin domain-containing protein [Bacteroidaceae bacterium]